MRPAHLGVILDSSIVIEAERQRLDVTRFLKHTTLCYATVRKSGVLTSRN